ncbi:hypothetical protein C7271_24585 [filamentous cyanobacterium CCP5]|nr:hypothetical protein C7271_24585 [filamentous cyanobacterium CCP5]
MVHLHRSARTVAPRTVKQLSGGLLLPLLLTVVVAGCRGGPTASSDPQPSPTAEVAPETAAPEVGTAPPPTTTPVPSPDQGVDTPPPSEPAAVVAAAALPDTLLKSWEPASQVLYEFGAMTIAADQIRWAKGQSSAYSVISTDGGYLLHLTSAPKFFDTAHPYIKLLPQTDAEGTINEVEVAFYEDEAAAKQDQYIMFGSYF